MFETTEMTHQGDLGVEEVAKVKEGGQRDVIDIVGTVIVFVVIVFVVVEYIVFFV